MRPFIILLTLILFGLSSSGQDTIRLMKVDHYFKGDGIDWYVDENQSGFKIDKKKKEGEYIIMLDTFLVAKLNYQSQKEYLILEYDTRNSAELRSLEYFPYFKVWYYYKDTIMEISELRVFSNDLSIQFNSADKSNIRFFDYKKRVWREIDGMTIIKE